MKVGDYVTVQAIKDQSVARWVVISDLKYNDYGDYTGIDGDIIRCIADTKREAGKVSTPLHLSGEDVILIRGAIEPLSVGGVFAK